MTINRRNWLSSSRQLGFTLIELVIVIVIIGILAAAAIPIFSGVTDDAHKGAADGVAAAANSVAAAEKALCQNPARNCTGTLACTGTGSIASKLTFETGQSLECKDSKCRGKVLANDVPYYSNVEVNGTCT